MNELKCTCAGNGEERKVTISEKEQEIAGILASVNDILVGFKGFLDGTCEPMGQAEGPKSFEENVDLNLMLAKTIRENVVDIRNRF